MNNRGGWTPNRRVWNVNLFGGENTFSELTTKSSESSMRFRVSLFSSSVFYLMMMRWQLAYPGRPLPIIGKLFGSSMLGGSDRHSLFRDNVSKLANPAGKRCPCGHRSARLSGTASALSTTGSASAQKPNLTSNAAPAAQPPMNPTMHGKVVRARRRAVVSSSASPRLRTSVTRSTVKL